MCFLFLYVTTLNILFLNLKKLASLDPHIILVQLSKTTLQQRMQPNACINATFCPTVNFGTITTGNPVDYGRTLEMDHKLLNYTLTVPNFASLVRIYHEISYIRSLRNDILLI